MNDAKKLWFFIFSINHFLQRIAKLTPSPVLVFMVAVTELEPTVSGL